MWKLWCPNMKRAVFTSHHSAQQDSIVLRMQSGVVHLQRSLRPLPGSGFHDNVICSILRLVPCSSLFHHWPSKVRSVLHLRVAASVLLTFCFCPDLLRVSFCICFLFSERSSVSVSNRGRISLLWGPAPFWFRECLFHCKAGLSLKSTTTPLPPQDWEGFSYWPSPCVNQPTFTSSIQIFVTLTFLFFCNKAKQSHVSTITAFFLVSLRALSFWENLIQQWAMLCMIEKKCEIIYSNCCCNHSTLQRP